MQKRKNFRNLINGLSDFEKWREMVIRRRKEQKQVFIQRRATIYTEARYFVMKIGLKLHL